ncbi:MAG: radical SAM protein [bacterium]
MDKSSVYTPKGIVFSPSYNCPAHCDHCNIPFDNVDTSIELQIETAKRVLAEGKALGLHAFQFAGAEPTLCEDFMVEVFKEGRRLSMKAHRPPTNCWLGGDPERLRNFFERLSDAGWSAGFRVSCDAFHARVPVEWTARFLATASEFFDLNRFIIGCCDIDEDRSRRRLELLAHAVRETGIEASVDCNCLVTSAGRIKIGFWAPTRPTWKALPDSAFSFRRVSTDPEAAARYDRDAPIGPFGCLGPGGVGYFWLDPNGDTRACCGNSNIFSSALVVGNVTREPLGAIYERALTSQLLNILARGGPVSLAIEAGAGDLLEGKYTHRCELCAALLADPRVLKLS